MGELIDFLVQKYSGGKSEAEDIMKKTRVKNAILAMCDSYLKPGDILEFEVLPRDLDSALIVFNEEPLKSTIIVEQIDSNLFSAKLVEMEIG